ncbi:hypothetical protein [Streptomyces sennicomposti]
MADESLEQLATEAWLYGYPLLTAEAVAVASAARACTAAATAAAPPAAAQGGVVFRDSWS